jgi:hypothetical protein
MRKRCLTFPTADAVREHPVDDPVHHGFLCGHEVVAFHVPGDPLERVRRENSDFGAEFGIFDPYRLIHEYKAAA